MKKMIVVMLFLIFEVSVMAEKVVYILAPEGYEELYITGMDRENKKNKEYGIEDKSEDWSYSKVNVDKKDYYGDVELLKVTLKTDSDIKIVAGYKMPGQKKYILLASDEIDKEKLKKNYKDGEKLEIIKVSDYEEYEDFPGYEVREEVILSSLRVGEKRTEEELEEGKAEYDNPTNIVEKFSSPSTGGDKIEPVDGGVGINPNAADSNNRFMIVTKNGPTTYVMKKKKKQDPASWVDIGDYYKKNKIENEVVTYLRLRVKGNNKIKINGKEVTLVGDGKPNDRKYEFTGEFAVTLNQNGNGNGSWTLEIEGEDVTISPRPDEAPDAVEDEVYVIEGDGIYTTGIIEVISKTEESKRQRISNIEIKVQENGENEFQIKNISE